MYIVHPLWVKNSIGGLIRTKTKFSTSGNYWPMNKCGMVNTSNSSGKSSNIKHTVSCNSTTHCIAPNWVCNGYEDCSNGEDELDCPSPEERRCKGQLLDGGSTWVDLLV